MYQVLSSCRTSRVLGRGEGTKDRNLGVPGPLDHLTHQSDPTFGQSPDVPCPPNLSVSGLGVTCRPDPNRTLERSFPRTNRQGFWSPSSSPSSWDFVTSGSGVERGSTTRPLSSLTDPPRGPRRGPCDTTKETGSHPWPETGPESEGVGVDGVTVGVSDGRSGLRRGRVSGDGPGTGSGVHSGPPPTAHLPPRADVLRYTHRTTVNPVKISGVSRIGTIRVHHGYLVYLVDQ